MSGNHTPTPWKSRRLKRSIEVFGSVTNKKVASVPLNAYVENTQNDANAEFIVTAVNSYASSQAEIERLREALEMCATLLPRYRHEGRTTGDDEELAAVLETVTEALSGSKE